MAGDRPVTFDEPTARRLIGLLRDRRNDVTPLRQEVPACVPTARRHRWAKATTNYLHPTFPTSGNVVLVEFGEYQFSAPTGVNQTVSPTWVPYTSNPYDGSGFALAIVPTGGTMPSNGEVVRVELDDGQWYLRPSAAAASWPTVSVLLYCDYVQGGGTNIDRTHIGGYGVYYSYGNESDIGFTANYAMTGYDDWAFSIGSAGWYLWALNWIPVDATISGTATKTYTTSTPSAGTSHTHTVDIERSYRLYGRTTLQRQAGGSGAWDYGVPASEIDAGLYRREIGYVWHHPADGYSAAVDGGNSACGVWSEKGIAANDRFRCQTSVWMDYWAVADGITWHANNEMLLQLTISRIGDAP